MKINHPVTDREQLLNQDDQLVSTTNLKGMTTYANQDFRRISGFSNDELVGRNHNIVRHPDMPPLAFADLWQRLKKDESWMGAVKNRCKNGDYYWVDAYISPIYENNQKVGYQSVRVRPSETLKQRADQVYTAINKGRQKAPKKRRSLISMVVGALLVQTLLWVALPQLGWDLVMQSVAGGVLGLLGAGFVGWRLAPLQRLSRQAREVIDNPVTQQVYTGRMDELGELELALLMQHAQLRTVIGRVEDATQELGQVAQSTDESVRSASEDSLDQHQRLDHVASAVSQLVSSIHEIETQTQEIGLAMQTMNEQTQQGQHQVGSSVEIVERLSAQLADTSQGIETLKAEADSIGDDVRAIADIADQTNLLALNAAIEAARAGEAGRGFAVVADAVRQLAQDTQGVTETITGRIQGIQRQVELAVEQMQTSRDEGTVSAEQIRATGDVLTTLTRAVDDVVVASERVASAIEQQASAGDDVSEHLESIRELAQAGLARADASSQSVADLSQEVKRMQSLSRAFR